MPKHTNRLPQLLLWLRPIPVFAGSIIGVGAIPLTTAGAEDSPFMANDRNEFYFFFTPDVRVPVEKQLLDSVTGIYMTRLIDGTITEPVRVMLQERGKLALDGCEFVHGDSLWFCSTREGYTGLHWFLAREVEGE